MEIIQTFNFKDNKLSVYGTSDEPLFVGKQVARMLEYRDTKKAILKHVDDVDKKRVSDLKGGETATLENAHPQTILINESGLYSLIMSSKQI